MTAAVPYDGLGPADVLDAIESVGFDCDGTILPLNSYENRVYQVSTESGVVVAKFYRPGRWSDAAILEEHEFALELEGHELPVVPPLVLDGATLHAHGGYRFAVFERRGGRWPELNTREDREWLGRFVGRLHAVGGASTFESRPTLSIESFGHESLDTLVGSDWIPEHLTESFEAIATDVLAACERNFDEVGACREIRLHGDCHRGNVLWTDSGPHFVDLDDCLNGPAVQDLWLFLAGPREEMEVQLRDLLAGYEAFCDFDPRELRLLEALRALRMLRHAAWIAGRWSDPAFPRAFPYFAETKFWEEQVLALREQRAALDEPNLALV